MVELDSRGTRLLTPRPAALGWRVTALAVPLDDAGLALAAALVLRGGRLIIGTSVRSPAPASSASAPPRRRPLA